VPENVTWWPVVQKLGWLALAGIFGTWARYGLTYLVPRLLGAGFPWGTLAVNALGCFLFGVVWMLWEDRLRISVETRTIVLVGFMGAFTTFSSFAFETAEQIRDSQWLLAGANIIGQNVLGLVCMFLGFAVGRWL
jgi:fluoride exporter